MSTVAAPRDPDASDPFQPLQTDRLILRCVRAVDAEATASMMNAAIAGRLASWPLPFTLEIAEERIRQARAAAVARSAMPCAILHQQSGTLLGWIDLVRMSDDPKRATLGYWIGEAHQGNGFMREAARVAMQAAFGFLDVAAIEAGAQLENAASFAVMRGLGMKPIGARDLFVKVRNRSEACIFYELRR
jgi:ribosomal-protein-alanine N-acetyltransferase